MTYLYQRVTLENVPDDEKYELDDGAMGFSWAIGLTISIPCTGVNVTDEAVPDV